MIKMCPRCNRINDDIGDCGNFALGCPTPVPLQEDEVIHLKCRECPRTTIVPVSELLSTGRRKMLGLPFKYNCKVYVERPPERLSADVPDPPKPYRGPRLDKSKPAPAK